MWHALEPERKKKECHLNFSSVFVTKSLVINTIDNNSINYNFIFECLVSQFKECLHNSDFLEFRYLGVICWDVVVFSLFRTGLLFLLYFRFRILYFFTFD